MEDGNNGTLRRTYLLLIATVTFWGSAFVGSKVAVSAVPPAVAAFLRFGLGAVFLLFYLATRERKVRSIPHGSRLIVWFLGFTGVAVYNWLFFWGLEYSLASDGSMIIPIMSPVVTCFLAVLFLNDRLSPLQLTGLALAMTGAAVFFFGAGATGTSADNRILGDLFFLGAAICWSVYTMVGNRVLARLDPLPVTAWAMAAGSLFLGLIALPELVRVEWSSLGWGFWLNQLYLSLFPTVLANWFYYRGVKNIGASRAAVFMYFVPISGLLLAAFVLGETLTLLQSAGSALMVGGVWLVNRRGDLRRVKEEQLKGQPPVQPANEPERADDAARTAVQR